MTPEQLDEIEEYAHARIVIGDAATAQLLLLVKAVREAREIIDHYERKDSSMFQAHLAEAKALMERDEARAEVERLTKALAQETSMRVMAERFHDCAVADRNAAQAQLTMLKLDREQALPCPFHPDGKHRCIGCGDIPAP